MALTDAALARALRLIVDDAELVEPLASEIARLNAVAAAYVERRAPAAPDAIKDEATIRMSGWLYDAPWSSARTGSAWIRSGAGSLAMPWSRRGAG